MNNTIGENYELDDILNDVEKVWGKISNLREATYTYINLWNGFYFNETFFNEFLWSKYEKDYINNESLGNKEWFYSNLKQNFISKINEIRKEIYSLKKTISDSDFVNKKDILYAVDTFEVALDFSETAVDFELEKAGLIELTEDYSTKLTEKQNKNDEKLFWEKVSNNVIYLKDNYYFLYKKFFVQNNEKPSNNEEMEWFLRIIENKIISLWWEINLDEINHNNPELSEYQKEFQELKKIKIPRSEYKKMFDLFFELAEVPQRSEIWNYSSFYDWDKVYWIPNNEKYKEKTLSELINLFFHETTHYINAKISKDRKLPKLPWDMIKEEWLAMVWSELVMWKKLEDISYIIRSFPDVIMFQLLNWKDFKRFITINKPELDINSKFNRWKRWYSKKYGWAFNKDASYPIWMYEVLEYLKSKKPLENLYSWKVWFDKVDSWEYIPEDFWNKFLYPLIMSEFIIFYLKNREGNKVDWIKNNFNIDFIKRLKDKYSDFEHYFDLFNETEVFSFSQKKKLLKIIKIINNSWVEK